jgi:hypothetical protein
LKDHDYIDLDSNLAGVGLKHLNKFLILPVLIVILVVPFSIQDAHAATFSATQDGNWDNPTTWGLPTGSSVPTTISSLDSFTIPAGVRVTIPAGETVTDNGNININGVLDVNGDLTVNAGGSINQVGTLNISSLSTYTVKFGSTVFNSGTLNDDGLMESFSDFFNFGTVYIGGGILDNEAGATFENAGTINLDSTGTFSNIGTLTNDSTGKVNNSGKISNTGTFSNAGAISENCGSSLTGNGVTGTAPINTCTSIPEFPIPFSLVFVFVVVAAMYIIIRQKMIPNFRRS